MIKKRLVGKKNSHLGKKGGNTKWENTAQGKKKPWATKRKPLCRLIKKGGPEESGENEKN